MELPVRKDWSMTTVYEIPLQFWIGSCDVNGMLASIGGWHVGSYAAMGHAPGIYYAEEQGWITKRKHFIPASDEVVDAYEVTDAWLDRLRKSYGPKAYARAKNMRQWYRDKWEAYTKAVQIPPH